MFVAIKVCKFLRFVGKLMGKGSSLPGKVALKICPDVLRRVELPKHIIAVTGSNGKTTTVELIAAILKADGRKVIYNEEGSNQIEGVTTLVLTNATSFGRVKGDVLLLESDERYARLIFKHFYPTQFVVTNLFRDQLTRNGHPEWVYDAVAAAIHPITELILNADDPISSALGRSHQRVKWFGLNRTPMSTEEPQGMYNDGGSCPMCLRPMTYYYAHHHHMGSYHCETCGFQRQKPDYAGTSLDLRKGTLVLDETVSVDLEFRSIYNVYNILAAYAVCRSASVSPELISGVINTYTLKGGRMQTFMLGGHNGTLLTSKHENSVAYDTNLRYIADYREDCVVLIIVDAVSRKYFTSETSWLWDIDFDQLNRSHIKRVILSGQYCNDLAERFSYTWLSADRWSVEPDIDAAAEQLKMDGDEDLFVLTCFSDRDKLLAHVEKKEG